MKLVYHSNLLLSLRTWTEKLPMVCSGNRYEEYWHTYNQLGGVNSAKYTGDINYTWVYAYLREPNAHSFSPITSTSPASQYWGIDQSITYGTNVILESTAGIVDTGTTLILIATDAFNKYRTATGGVPDSDTGLLRITPEQFSNLKSLYFNINNVGYCVFSPCFAKYAGIGCSWNHSRRTSLASCFEFLYRRNVWLSVPYRQWSWVKLWWRSRLHRRFHVPWEVLLGLRYCQPSRWTCYYYFHLGKGQ